MKNRVSLKIWPLFEGAAEGPVGIGALLAIVVLFIVARYWSVWFS